jgi:outer membrane protein OmpA-like peptidoglycan-associated protein
MTHWDAGTRDGFAQGRRYRAHLCEKASVRVAAAATAVLVALSLVGCGSAPRRGEGQATEPPGGPAPTAPEVAVQNVTGLATERQWLQSWFKGTPVQIVQTEDTRVTVDVPLEFCFEPGRDDVRPALGAVLDKVAESLRRRPALQLTRVAAPPDRDGAGAAAGNALALQRAGAVRSRLRTRGVPAARIATPSATREPAVQLRLEVPPA